MTVINLARNINAKILTDSRAIAKIMPVSNDAHKLILVWIVDTPRNMRTRSIIEGFYICGRCEKLLIIKRELMFAITRHCLDFKFVAVPHSQLVCEQHFVFAQKLHDTLICVTCDTGKR